MVSVAVSKLGKTDLVFVQPGAKINNIYYCENVLELRVRSNKVYCRQFAVSRTGRGAMHAIHHTFQCA